ncbi:YcjF family protein [Pseudoalteromonas sp. T1lg65]|uniref:YcjF family protein n=1 Tax=Pseudoalteromonas sp. T1lg65 TaxID=2077101 RepID=UPI003F79FF0A
MTTTKTAKDEKATDNVSQPEATVVDAQDQAAVAQMVVDKYTKWSFGSGFIPVPAVDLVALTGIQMKMIGEIAKVYGQSYGENKLRGTVSALIGGSFPQTLGGAGLSSFLKSVPILGTLSAIAFMPVVSAASTHAIGSTFIRHFENGGTLINLDLASMKGDISELAAKYRAKKGNAAQASSASA